MAKRLTYSKWACVAISAGAALMAVEVIGAVGYLVNQDQPSYLVAGGALVTVVVGLGPRAPVDRRRRPFAEAPQGVAEANG